MRFVLLRLDADPPHQVLQHIPGQTSLLGLVWLFLVPPYLLEIALVCFLNSGLQHLLFKCLFCSVDSVAIHGLLSF